MNCTTPALQQAARQRTLAVGASSTLVPTHYPVSTIPAYRPQTHKARPNTHAGSDGAWMPRKRPAAARRHWSDAQGLFYAVQHAGLDHVLEHGHGLLLLHLPRRLLGGNILVDDLVAPAQAGLELGQVGVRPHRHVGQLPLALEDTSGHALVETVLEHALGERRVEPGADEALRLAVRLQDGDGIPQVLALGPAVQVEERRAVLGRPLGAALPRALHATLLPA